MIDTVQPPDDGTMTRLRAEAAFQAQRTRAGTEPRDKYYFVAARAMRRYRDMLEAVAGKRVLVVGCAEGGVTPLARRGAEVVGIDISEEPILRLREAIAREGLSERATACVMNGETPQFPAASFDIICCTGVLHHLDVPRACAAWARILKPGGQVVMLEPMAWNPVVALYRLATPGSRTSDEHPLRPSDIATLESHFAAVRVEPFVLLSVFTAAWAFLPGARRSRTLTLRTLEWIDERLLAAFPALRFLCWTAVICCSGPIDVMHRGGTKL